MAQPVYVSSGAVTAGGFATTAAIQIDFGAGSDLGLIVQAYNDAGGSATNISSITVGGTMSGGTTTGTVGVAGTKNVGGTISGGTALTLETQVVGTSFLGITGNARAGRIASGVPTGVQWVQVVDSDANAKPSLVAYVASGVASIAAGTQFGGLSTTPSINVSSTSNALCAALFYASIDDSYTASATAPTVQRLRGLVASSSPPGNTFAWEETGASGTVNLTGSITGTFTPGFAGTVWSLEGEAGAPVLTSPTGAATGNTTANAGATIDAVSGSGSRIMYALPRIGGSAASSATIIATGTQLAATSAGAKSVPLTGLTNGASYSADIVYVDATTGTSNVVTSSWTQTAAPVLSSPTNTPGSTTALIGATTTVSSGTAYFLARVGGSAASAATIIATGQTSTVTTTTPSRTVTGLTASTANNYVDIVQVSGVTTSNVVSTAAFTTTASGDATVPTLGGSIIIGTVTSSSIQTSLSQAGADNVGVTSYEVSSNSGGSWLDIGIPGSLSYTFPGLSASTSYPLWWRAKDAAGNVSTALTATQSTAAASGVGSISLNNAALYTFKMNNGTSLVSLPVTFYVSDVSTGALIGSAITGLSTNAQGVVTTAISNASMLAGTTYRLSYEFSSGEYGSVKLPAV